MREWLAALKVEGAHAAFTLDQLPAFIPAEASRRSETAIVADTQMTRAHDCHSLQQSRLSHLAVDRTESWTVAV